MEAAIHTVTSFFDDKFYECVLLVDVTNAFNSLNRQTALQNILHLCPALATIIVNSYRQDVHLFAGNTVFKSEEGTTQGDTLAMSFYALATIPQIRELYTYSLAKQVWYADDSFATGSLPDVRKWWDTLVHQGPAYGYFANNRKTWFVVKESVKMEAKELFGDTSIAITNT